jgi:CDP-glucose 4,6-dehydratase
MGARVVGYSLRPPTVPNFYEGVRLETSVPGTLGDVRDAPRLRQAIAVAEPEIIFHLAAQPLVGAAFCDPHETLMINIVGSINVLQAAQGIPALRALVVCTSDKVYAHRGEPRAFREDDPLGGQEPYALSKASAELVVSAYRASQIMRQRPDLCLLTVRAGNIIGGGDWAKDRLVPDAMRAFAAGTPLVVRKPNAVRPWQYVLDAVGGLLVATEQACRDPARFGGAWNLGPSGEAARTVAQVADLLARQWGAGASWRVAGDPGIPETHRLEIDSGKAAEQLHWRTRWPLDAVIAETVAWYRAFMDGGDVVSISGRQIDRHWGQAGVPTRRGVR